jgi:two-component system, LytTR family, sensor histidine kinase AlgZ
MLFASTLRALVAPRRFVPFVLVGGPLLLAQARLSSHPLALWLGILMLAAFLLFGPFLWRLCGPNGPLWLRGLGLLGFGIAGAVLIFGIGHVLAGLAGRGSSFMTADESLWIVLAMFWVGGWGLGRDIDNEIRLAATAKQLERAELLAIRAHLDPHFLFNTLNAIAEWCREDGKVAEEAILQLSQLLREVLAGIRAPLWPLARELEIVRGLFALHRIRDPGAWQLVESVDAAALEWPVPPMVLLPLAENAMKHGPSAGNRGDVGLRVIAGGGGLRVEIENPGAFAGPREGGEGLSLTKKRLEAAFGGAASFSIRGEAARTVATVVIPERAA